MVPKFPLPKFSNSTVKTALKGALAGDEDSLFNLRRTVRRQPKTEEGYTAQKEARLALSLVDLKQSLDQLGNEEFTILCVRAIKGKETSVDILGMTAKNLGPSQAVALQAEDYIKRVKKFKDG